MRNLNLVNKILIAGIAAGALSVASVQAQEGLLNDVTSGITDTVDSVTNEITGGDLSNTIDNVTGNSGNAGNAGDIGNGTQVGDVGDVGGVSDIGNFSDLLSLVDSGNTDVSDLSDISDVRVVDAQDAFNDFDANALNDVLSNNATDISALQDSINGNSVLSDMLSGNNVDVSDVIGVNNTNNGSLIIYTSSNE